MRVKRLFLSILVSFLLIFLMSSVQVSFEPVQNDLTVREIYSRYHMCVGRLIVTDGIESGYAFYGTGFVISEDGLFVTAAHVVYDDSVGRLLRLIKVRLGPKDSGILCNAKVLKVDILHDIALLKIAVADESERKPDKFQCVVIDHSGMPSAGDGVVTIGYPKMFDCILAVGVVANGRSMSVEIDEREVEYDDVVPTTLYLIAGNSGGPIFSMQGRVVGVVTAGTEGPLSVYQKIRYLNRLLKDGSDRVIILKRASGKRR